MKINQKCNGTINPKTGKKYSLDFKKRTVEYYLLGMYDEQQIWKKFQINRTLLEKWRKWYYEYFESPNYAELNYGKGKIPARRIATAESTIKRGSESAKKRKNEDPWAGIINPNSRGGLSGESKKKGYPSKAVQFESALISQRVKAGMARAKAQGKRVSRPTISKGIQKRIEELYKDKVSIKQISQKLGISHGSAWKYVQQLR